MKNRILLTIAAFFVATVLFTSCSKEKISEIAKQHSRDNARSSGQSSSSGYSDAPSSENGPCSNHDDNSGSGSSNSGSGN